MELTDYQNKLKTLEEVFKKDKQALQIKYALSQALCKEGDIISYTNTFTTIKVTKIGCDISYGNPIPVYTGIELKKDLTPKKSGEIRSIYGNEQLIIVKTA